MAGGKRDKKEKARRVSEPKALQTVFFGKQGSVRALELARDEKLGLLGSPASSAAQTPNVKSENLSVPFDVTSDIFVPVALGNGHGAGRNDEPERDSLDADTIHEPAGVGETHSNVGAASEEAHRARSTERFSSSSSNRHSPDQEIPLGRPGPSYLSASRTSSRSPDKGRVEDNSPIRNGGSGGGGVRNGGSPMGGVRNGGSGGGWLSSKAAQQRGGWLSSAVAQQRERARRNTFEQDENDAVELMVRGASSLLS